MRIAFTAKGAEWESAIDARFGRADYLVVYDEEKKELTSYDNREIANVAHGAGPQTAQKLFEMKAEVLLTGNGPGGNAATVLSRANVIIFTGAGGMSIKEAYDAYKNNTLKQQ